ncbi:Dipeptidyl-peptidase 6 [Bienertia sinuspersici]
MPGPGPHMMYTLGSGVGLMISSQGRFSPHHCLCYALNAFFGPDIGPFSKWLTSTVGLGSTMGSTVSDLIHHPLYYVCILGIPLSLVYSLISRLVLYKGLLDSVSGVPLSQTQCFMLISAGSLSHFFLDHLFEENGKSSTYTWILSTGWWNGRAPINPDAVVVVSLLCIGLIVGFTYIHRVMPTKSIKAQYNQSVKLILVIATLYCLWCASQIYLVSPRRPAVGEEADLGVLVFLFTYFFLPNCLCIASMNPKGYHDAMEQLPL